jgi:hypothetical protein
MLLLAGGPMVATAVEFYEQPIRASQGTGAVIALGITLVALWVYQAAMINAGRADRARKFGALRWALHGVLGIAWLIGFIAGAATPETTAEWAARITISILIVGTPLASAMLGRFAFEHLDSFDFEPQATGDGTLAAGEPPSQESVQAASPGGRSAAKAPQDR